MITAAIWCTGTAIYGLYCVAQPDLYTMHDWQVRGAVAGGVALFAAAILLTIAVNR